MKKNLIKRKFSIILSVVILVSIVLFNFAGMVKESKISQPKTCDQTTEMDAIISFGAGPNLLPFQYPTTYNGCARMGPYFTPHLSYNSVLNQANLSTSGAPSEYYCMVLVTAICNAGSQYTKSYPWKSGATMTIKILKNTPVTIEVKYIDGTNVCNSSGSSKRTIWFGTYRNDDRVIESQITITTTWGGLY